MRNEGIMLVFVTGATEALGRHLLPGLVGRARAIAVDGYFRDIGTMEAYQRACREWPTRAERART